MRVIFAGSDPFSLPVLGALARSRHRPLLVLTAPERSGNRGRPAPRPVAELARSLELPLSQPERVSSGPGPVQEAAGSAQGLVAAAYGQLLPQDLLSALEQGGIGVHPSLLPRHRGASPVVAAILAGEEQTGVTIFRMTPEWDAGPILAQEALALHPTETSPELEQRLGEQAGPLLVSVLDRLDEGGLPERAQPVAGASYAAKLRREDGRVDWQLPAREIDRRLRALQPWPGVTLPLAGRQVKLLAGQVVATSGEPGARPGAVVGVAGEGVLVATVSGVYRLDRVLPPGGRAMSAAAYLRGRRPQLGSSSDA